MKKRKKSKKNEKKEHNVIDGVQCMGLNEKQPCIYYWPASG